MSPEVLAEYLRVMRDAGLMQASMKTDDLELSVVFAPEASIGLGTAPTPGGWKGPSRLDDPAVLFPLSEEPDRG